MARLKMITIEKLLTMRECGEDFKLVDVLPAETFAKGHLPGAISMPGKELEDSARDELNRKDTIVVYCANYPCHASTDAARKLLELGFKRVYDFKAGKQGWKDAGFELEVPSQTVAA